jgi:cobalt-zinc-cadmium resistance protein CzcA
MDLFGISVNLMSLGAIDFGTIVDGSVVMVEGCMHRLENGERDKPLTEIIREAAHELSRPVIFGVLIIIAVYLPVLTLQSLEGRMFRPMAVTVVSALLGSLLLALFIVPTLCTLALRYKAKVYANERSHGDRSRAGRESWLDRLRGMYGRSLEKTSRHSKPILLTALVLVVVALGSLPFIGTEFMPTLDEGSMVVTSKRLPGISLTRSIAIGNQIESTIKSFPEVQSIVTKLGRPDLATEAMGEYESDSYISFTPEMQDASNAKKQEFSDRLEKALNKIPGVTYEFTQPMQMRMDETITGSRGDVALKIFGEDLNTLEQLGHQAEHIIASVKGASETQTELISGAEELQVRVDRAAAARSTRT